MRTTIWATVIVSAEKLALTGLSSVPRSKPSKILFSKQNALRTRRIFAIVGRLTTQRMLRRPGGFPPTLHPTFQLRRRENSTPASYFVFLLPTAKCAHCRNGRKLLPRIPVVVREALGLFQDAVYVASDVRSVKLEQSQGRPPFCPVAGKEGDA